MKLKCPKFEHVCVSVVKLQKIAGKKQKNIFCRVPPSWHSKKGYNFFLKFRRVLDHDTRERILALPSAADLALVNDPLSHPGF